MPLINANCHDCKIRISAYIMVKHFQYLILLEKISHIDAQLPLCFKIFKKISEAIFQKTQIMHIMHMNNISHKSNFICKNYLTKVACMMSINPELDLLNCTLYIASEI